MPFNLKLRVTDFFFFTLWGSLTKYHHTCLLFSNWPMNHHIMYAYENDEWKLIDYSLVTGKLIRHMYVKGKLKEHSFRGLQWLCQFSRLLNIHIQSIFPCLYIKNDFVQVELWNPEMARRNAECLLNVMQLVKQRLVAWQEKQTEKKAKHKNQASSTRVLFYFKGVAFIPQLKSLLWQIARFTVEPEWHLHT